MANQQNEWNVTLNDHIVNRGKRGNIHIAVSKNRFELLKKAFPNLPDSFTWGRKFCMMENGYDGHVSGRQHTESPASSNCNKCRQKAREWEYGVLNLNSKGTFRLSKTSMQKITSWIPTNCQIVVSCQGIEVVDGLTGERIKVESIAKASVLIAEKCFKPFDPPNLVGDIPFLTKDIYDFNNGKYFAQGINISKTTGKFNGLILRSAKNDQLQNLTFTQLFELGFHFEDGTPCGEYVKNRQPFVETEVEESMGIDFMELDD
jgi:hypothetical protein